jgi:hypothetical protein
MGVGGKLPDEPEIVEVLQATESLCLTVGRLEDNTAFQPINESTLARDAKLRFQRRTEKSNRFYLHGGEGTKKNPFSALVSEEITTFATWNKRKLPSTALSAAS